MSHSDAQLLARIEKALDVVRPYLQADQGNVSVLEVTDDMVLKIRLEGACSSCSMSMMTMKAGIEQTILRAIPEIKAVVSVREEEEFL